MHRQMLERQKNIALSDVQKMVKIAFLGKEDTFVPDFVNRWIFEKAWAILTFPV